MNWYLKVFKQYFDFSGRARRKEYWMFTFFNAIIILLLMLIMGVGIASKNSGLTAIGGFLFFGYNLATIIPSLAVCVRRLHDTNRSGWSYFVVFIPFIGFIMLLIWFCTESEESENEWGVNPKELEQKRE